MEDQKINDFKKKMEQSMGQLDPLLKQFTSEVRKIQTPKKQKNLRIGEEDVVMSLIEDGRVIIRFSTTDSADKFFTDCDGMESNKIGFFKKLFKKA
jgi:hypothetical protein